MNEGSAYIGNWGLEQTYKWKRAERDRSKIRFANWLRKSFWLTTTFTFNQSPGGGLDTAIKDF